MTEKKYRANGYLINRDFTLNGKVYTIDNTFGRYFTARCKTTEETLCTRGLFTTCANKIEAHSKK